MIISNLQVLGEHFLRNYARLNVTPFLYIDGTLTEYLYGYGAAEEQTIDSDMVVRAIEMESLSFPALSATMSDGSKVTTSAASAGLTYTANGTGGVAPNALTITSPASGATETGAFTVSGTAGSNWNDIAAFDSNWNKLDSVDVTPSNGTFTLNVNQLGTLATGSNNLYISAFSKSTNPPGQTWAGTEDDLNLTINYQPSASGGGGGGGSSPQPNGVSGNWTLVFDDEFNLDNGKLETKWSCSEGLSQNNVTDHCSNVTISGGYLVLSMPSTTSGALLCSQPPGDTSDCSTATPNGYALKVGQFAEASVYVSGNSSNVPYNWNAWWTSGPNWPAAGENDIAETAQGDGSQLCISYHSSSQSDYEAGCPPGTWANGFHTYGIYRQASSVQIYWDGVLVANYSTSDNGQPQELILNTGYPSAVYGPTKTGTGLVKVKYVRVWQPN